MLKLQGDKDSHRHSARQGELHEHPAAKTPTDDGPADDGLQLHDISTALIQENNLDALYARIMDAAIRLMASDVASMQVFHPERNDLQLLCSKGFHPDSAAFWQWVRFDSGSTCGLAIAAGSRVVVPDVEVCEAMAGTLDLEEYRRSNIRAVQSTPLVSRSGTLLGMISTHWREPHQPTDRALQRFDVLGRQAADLIERGRIEIALRESEQNLRWLASIVVSSHDAIISKDISGTITTWNNAAELLFGYTSEEVIGRPITLLIPPDRRSEELLILERISRGERIENYETVRRRRDGSSVDVSLTISPVRNAEGTIIGASKIARDITRRKRVEAREKMLTAELDHRVKNVLAQVAAIAKSTREGSRSVDEFLRSLDGRIQSLAAAHTLLTQSGWQGVGVDALVRSQLAPYASDTNITIRGTDVILAVPEIQVLTRVLHELATNAAKYGALSIPDGKVSISWGREPKGQAATLVLEWHEVGGPPVVSEFQSSYGTSLIRDLIPQELGGKVDLVFVPDGAFCRIEFPLKRVSSDHAE